LVAFPFIFFMEWLRSNLTGLPGLHLIIYGALLLLVMIYYPGGLAQLYYRLAERIKTRTNTD
jgi:branched-chain amino acid transport system permease protein